MIHWILWTAVSTLQSFSLLLDFQLLVGVVSLNARTHTQSKQASLKCVVC